MADAILNLCTFCGKSAPSRSTVNKKGERCTNVFCSRACYDAHRTAIREQRGKNCANCGKKFIPLPGSAARFCSWDCRVASKRVPAKNCINCGCLFTPIKLMKRTYGFEYVGVSCYSTCSKDCDIEWRRRNPVRKEKISIAFSGEKHPNWKGGRSHDSNASFRGADWNKIAESVRKRDGYICQHCGMTQDEHVEKFRCALHAHHIVPYHNFSRASDANKKSNLVSLCKPCHRRAEALVPAVQMTLPLASNRSGQRPGYKRGADINSAKLTEADVRKILQSKGEKSARQLSREYEVRATTITNIWKRITWRHVIEDAQSCRD